MFQIEGAIILYNKYTFGIFPTLSERAQLCNILKKILNIPKLNYLTFN